MKIITNKILSILLILCFLSAIMVNCFAIEANRKKNERDGKQIKESIIISLRKDKRKNHSGYSWNYNEIIDNNSEFPTRWNSGGTNSEHEFIIDEAIDLANITIRSRYRTLMKGVCRKCDIFYKKKSDNKQIRYCSAFHGSRNYFGTLMYLWAFARSFAQLSDNDDISAFVNNTNNSIINQMAQAGANVYRNDGVTVRDQYTILFQSIKELVVRYNSNEIQGDDEMPDSSLPSVNFSTSGDTRKGRCKYIVYGAIAHLLGDVYAHRTCVPMQSMYPFLYSMTHNANYNVTYNSNIHFSVNIFSDFNNKTGLLNSVLNHTVGFSSIKKYYFLNGSEEGIPDNVINTLSAKADDPSFYSERESDSISATCYFLEYYLDGYDSFCIIPLYYGLEDINQNLEDIGEEGDFTPNMV